MKLLSFKNHRFIVVFELSDFHVIVLEVLKPCLRVLTIAALKDSVSKLSVLLRVSGNWNSARIAEGESEGMVVRVISRNVRV